MLYSFVGASTNNDLLLTLFSPSSHSLYPYSPFSIHNPLLTLFSPSISGILGQDSPGDVKHDKRWVLCVMAYTIHPSYHCLNCFSTTNHFLPFPHPISLSHFPFPFPYPISPSHFPITFPLPVSSYTLYHLHHLHPSLRGHRDSRRRGEAQTHNESRGVCGQRRDCTYILLHTYYYLRNITHYYIHTITYYYIHTITYILLHTITYILLYTITYILLHTITYILLHTIEYYADLGHTFTLLHTSK
jgi:hypothetical protein